MKNLEQIANENPNIGDSKINVISIGVNMKCDKVITKSILFKGSNGWIMENGGLLLRCTKLDDLYLDTKENISQLRAILKESTIIKSN